MATTKKKSIDKLSVNTLVNRANKKAIEKQYSLNGAVKNADWTTKEAKELLKRAGLKAKQVNVKFVADNWKHKYENELYKLIKVDSIEMLVKVDKWTTKDIYIFVAGLACGAAAAEEPTEPSNTLSSLFEVKEAA